MSNILDGELVRRGPVKRSHREVVGAADMDSELLGEVIEGVETVIGVKAFLVLSMASFHLAVVTRCVRTDQLKAISPIPPMKESIERGQTDPSEAIKAFQRYQMSCQTALDEIVSYLNGADYLEVKELIDQITATSNQCFQVAEEEIAAYKKLRDFNGRISAQQTLDTETKYPGSFPAHTLAFCRDLLQNTDGLSYEIISQNIGQINEKLVATYENFYRPLLALKRTIFEQIDNEVQKEADSILHLWRK